MKCKIVLQSFGKLSGNVGEDGLNRVELWWAGREVEMTNYFGSEELSYRLLAVDVYIV